MFHTGSDPKFPYCVTLNNLSKINLIVSIAPQIKIRILNMPYKALNGLALSTILASSCSPFPTGLLSVPHIHWTCSLPRAYALLYPHHHVNSYSYFRDHFQVTSSGQPYLIKLKSPIIGSHLPCDVPLLHCTCHNCNFTFVVIIWFTI